MALNVDLTVNGQQHALAIDPRQSVLDLLRDSLGVMSAWAPAPDGDTVSCGPAWRPRNEVPSDTEVLSSNVIALSTAPSGTVKRK